MLVPILFLYNSFARAKDFLFPRVVSAGSFLTLDPTPSTFSNKTNRAAAACHKRVENAQEPQRFHCTAPPAAELTVVAEGDSMSASRSLSAQIFAHLDNARRTIGKQKDFGEKQ